MLNYETLLSNYDDKLTLMQWLKKVEDALNDASAVSFDVVNLGNATFKFKIVFEDGSEIESGPLVINQGDSVASAAIVNGDLILTLTNGDTIDAGNMFDGNVNITGTLDVAGDVSTNGDLTAGIITGSKLQSTGDISASGSITGGEIVENMVGYGFTLGSDTLQNVAYAGVVKNGNKITFALAADITPDTTFMNNGGGLLGMFQIPQEIWDRLYPFYGLSNVLAFGDLKLVVTQGNYVSATTRTSKSPNPYRINVYLLSTGMTAGTQYYYRFEATYLLSDNLAA